MKSEKFNFQNTLAFFMVAVACFYLFFYPSRTHLEKLSTPEQINAAIQLASNDAQIRTFAIALVMLIGTFYYGSSKSSQTKDNTLQNIAAGGDGGNSNTDTINTDTIKTDKIETGAGDKITISKKEDVKPAETEIID